MPRTSGSRVVQRVSYSEQMEGNSPITFIVPSASVRKRPEKNITRKRISQYSEYWEDRPEASVDMHSKEANEQEDEEDAVSNEQAGNDEIGQQEEPDLGQDDDDDEVQGDEDEDEDEDGEDEEEEEEEEEDDQLSPSPSPVRSTPNKGRRAVAGKSQSSPGQKKKPQPLKIRLKFSGVSTSNATPTPSDDTPQPLLRKALDRDIESEDDEDEDETSTRSTSYAGPSRMTHRQAALAGVVEPTELLSLEEPISKKKKYLNETELALKREETARKRKNLSVKKLEDEKAETINRLLKKQSRSRTKRTAAPATDAADEEADVDPDDVSATAQSPPLPTMFRWVSSIKPDALPMSFSIPASFLPGSAVSLSSESSGTPPVGAESSDSMDVDRNPVNQPFVHDFAKVPPTPPPKVVPLCDYAGCKFPRKYKLVKDPSKGGCGMEHLKALQAAF